MTLEEVVSLQVSENCLAKIFQVHKSQQVCIAVD